MITTPRRSRRRRNHRHNGRRNARPVLGGRAASSCLSWPLVVTTSLFVVVVVLVLVVVVVVDVVDAQGGVDGGGNGADLVKALKPLVCRGEGVCELDAFDLPDLDTADTPQVLPVQLEEDGPVTNCRFVPEVSWEHWYGEDGDATCNFYLVKSPPPANPGADEGPDLLFGSVVTADTVYQIAPDMKTGALVTKATKYWEFPDERDPKGEDEKLARRLASYDPDQHLSTFADIDRPFILEPRYEDVLIDHDRRRGPRRSDHIHPRLNGTTASDGASIQPEEEKDGGGGGHADAHAHGHGNRYERRRLADDLGENLDVMVLWTKRAECKNDERPGDCAVDEDTEQKMLGLVGLAVAETNAAYAASGVLTSLRLVHAYRDPLYTEDSRDAFDVALEDITDVDKDKFEYDVHDLRAKYGADLVALIIDDPDYCGIAWIGPRKDLMFSVTAWNCATGYFSFGHEICHNQGCRHDRGTTNSCEKGSSTYGHGWRDPSARFRSILSYNCASGQCDRNAGGGCPRIQRFSNPLTTFDGRMLGDGSNDNRRQINDVRKEVAKYFPVSSNTGTTITTPTTAPPGSSCNEDDEDYEVRFDHPWFFGFYVMTEPCSFMGQGWLNQWKYCSATVNSVNFGDGFDDVDGNPKVYEFCQTQCPDQSGC